MIRPVHVRASRGFVTQESIVYSMSQSAVIGKGQACAIPYYRLRLRTPRSPAVGLHLILGPYDSLTASMRFGTRRCTGIGSESVYPIQLCIHNLI